MKNYALFWMALALIGCSAGQSGQEPQQGVTGRYCNSVHGCSYWIELEGDGSFEMSNGGRGTYAVRGKKLYFTHMGETGEYRIEGKTLVGGTKDDVWVKVPDSPLMPEARKVAKEVWAKKLVSCGNDRYITDVYVPAGLVGTVEYRTVSVYVKESPVSPADKMNGIEWKGSSYLTCKASRLFQAHRWGPWEDGCLSGAKLVFSQPTVHMVKKNGKWAFNMPYKHEPPTMKCEQLP